MGKMITVDALGCQCPIPVVKANQALNTAQAGDTVEIHVDNDIAVQNLVKMANNRKCASQSEQAGEKHYIVRITAAESMGTAPAAAELDLQACDVSAGAETATGGNKAGKEHMIAVISSAEMGIGNEKLGKVLIKGFLYALSQLERLPEKVLFYNGGVKLTTEGSESIEDLKAMEEQGVKIYSCGTCLDYYGLKDKLQVGEVTNMYDIVEAMAAATKIIKP